ncbi:hypothetical protein NBRC111894_1494 [Sporolactobacillus inulinus]|uniref:Uncharacterized protein n=1 Tax=Sporolactobacillus inulinus TaxID=2078 RepID=A0A4Y1ZA80_9BACL|nr:hypothetical protein NBRC111894_1494 [Sporolactobacillus inulinus]
MSARKKELQSNTITPWLWLSLTCVLFFLILVIAVRQPAVQALDQALIKSLDPIRTPSMVAFFPDLLILLRANCCRSLLLFLWCICYCTSAICRSLFYRFFPVGAPDKCSVEGLGDSGSSADAPSGS